MVFLRGRTYLRAGKGREAAAEFEKILHHRGIDPLGLLYPLSHLELARAYQLAGDTAQARRYYQDFLALWKDADPDVPLLQQAKAEYARLRSTPPKARVAPRGLQQRPAVCGRNRCDFGTDP